VGTPEEGLKDRIAREMREALKGGEKVRLGALRLLSAAVKNREVEVRHELSDDEVREVAGREAKRRTEAVEAYEKAGHIDRADRERAERDALEPYLLPQLSEDEIDALIEEAVAATGANGPGELGKVMGYVMGRARGTVDGSTVRARVQSRLGS
jgi:uncharacterized protein